MVMHVAALRPCASRSIRRLISGPVRPRAMLYELAPRQAREHSCDPVGAVEFLYDNGYKYVQDALWRTEGKSDMQVGIRMRASFSGCAYVVGKAGLSECVRAYVHACMCASVLVCALACRWW